MDHAFDVSEYLRIRALGFEQNTGKATNRQYVDSTTPMVLTRVEQAATSTDLPVRQLRELGELFGEMLNLATEEAWLKYTDDKKNNPGTWQDAAAARYWPAAEDEFWSRFRQLTRSDNTAESNFDFQNACRAFGQHALEAYETVTGSVTRTARGAKAVAGARAIILTAVKDPLKAMERAKKKKAAKKS
ncbi:CRISPR type I-E-associated protein CasA/Cse1 [Streptomyces filamentosus]